MKNFSQYLNEIRTAEKALAAFDEVQKRNPRSSLDIAMHGSRFGHETPLAGTPQKHPIRSLLGRLKHYPDDPKKRPTPVEKTVKIKNIVATQPSIQGDVVKKYIKHYAENPDEAEKASIHTYPHPDSDKVNVGDGHHRLAALKALGYKSINVKHFEKQQQ